VDENFPELRELPVIDLRIRTIRLDAPQRELVGIRASFIPQRLLPEVPLLEGIYPNWIGCVPLEVREVETGCSLQGIEYLAQIVDDETGMGIGGAYVRSETLDGEVFRERETEGDRFILVEDGSVIAERASALVSQDRQLRSVKFRVIIAKIGYATLVRHLTVTANRCGIGDVEGDLEFRLVKGPPGDDDVFRNVSYPKGATLPMTRSPRPITGHSATLFQDGKVLIFGGGNDSNTIEVYDPTTNYWAARSGPLQTGRSHGVLLQDGRVLVAGGLDSPRSERPYSTALIGPPGVSLGPGPRMRSVNYINTLTLLDDGRVLVVGEGTPSTEVYDPRNNQWALAGDMSVVRRVHTVTLLSDGRVLAVGGFDGASASGFLNSSSELFDPALGLWSLTGSMNEPRESHTATLLGDGKVLVVGGQAFSGKILATTEIYDPATGDWIPSASLNSAREDHTAILLLDGRVLVAGGRTAAEGWTRRTEIYDPSTGAWSSAAQMEEARRDHTATRLLDGRVLVVGGTRGTGMYASAEIYDPVTDSWN
jgi:hypothetical protein